MGRIKTYDQHEAFAIAWFAKLEMRGDLIGSKCSVEYIKDLGASMKQRLADSITMTDCFEGVKALGQVEF